MATKTATKPTAKPTAVSEPEPVTHEERAELRKEMAAAVREGKDPVRVAAEYGVTLATLRLNCREHRVKWPQLPRITQRTIEVLKIIAMMLDGKKDAEIAEKFGVTRQQVNKVRQDAKEAGVIKKGRGE